MYGQFYARTGYGARFVPFFVGTMHRNKDIMGHSKQFKPLGGYGSSPGNMGVTGVLLPFFALFDPNPIVIYTYYNTLIITMFHSNIDPSFPTGWQNAM